MQGPKAGEVKDLSPKALDKFTTQLSGEDTYSGFPRTDLEAAAPKLYAVRERMNSLRKYFNGVRHPESRDDVASFAVKGVFQPWKEAPWKTVIDADRLHDWLQEVPRVKNTKDGELEKRQERLEQEIPNPKLRRLVADEEVKVRTLEGISYIPDIRKPPMSMTQFLKEVLGEERAKATGGDPMHGMYAKKN